MPVMVILGLSNGQPTPYDEQYLVEFDPTIDGIDPWGRRMSCFIKTSPLHSEALKGTVAELVKIYHTVDPRQPLRPDGMPNKPLTSFSVSIEL